MAAKLGSVSVVKLLDELAYEYGVAQAKIDLTPTGTPTHAFVIGRAQGVQSGLRKAFRVIDVFDVDADGVRDLPAYQEGYASIQSVLVS